ncbi:hypothetical protein AC1031_003241 [Aphanomyces cochlioides]|nr:hypothetical protein AC1031_003241 [Aphanomyces cochlioides]
MAIFLLFCLCLYVVAGCLEHSSVETTTSNAFPMVPLSFRSVPVMTQAPATTIFASTGHLSVLPTNSPSVSPHASPSPISTLVPSTTSIFQSVKETPRADEKTWFARNWICILLVSILVVALCLVLVVWRYLSLRLKRELVKISTLDDITTPSDYTIQVSTTISYAVNMTPSKYMGFSIQDPYATCISPANNNDDSCHDYSCGTRELALSISGSNTCDDDDNVDSNTFEGEMEGHNSLELSWLSHLDTFQLLSISSA